MTYPFEKCTCGHTRAAHKPPSGTGECSVGICNCRKFTAPEEPQTLVVEADVCGAPNGFGPYSHVTCSYPAGHGRLSISVADDQDPQEADHGNPDAAIWWDEELSPEVCNHAAGFTNADCPLVCSTCGTPYCSTRAGLTLEQVEDLVDQPDGQVVHTPVLFKYAGPNGRSHLLGEDGSAVLGLDDDPPESSYADAGTPPPFFPYNPMFGARSPLLQRIYDAIDQGWEDHEFDTDCATDAVQELLADLLVELSGYYDSSLADLADLVRKDGGWVK